MSVPHGSIGKNLHDGLIMLIIGPKQLSLLAFEALTMHKVWPKQTHNSCHWAPLSQGIYTGAKKLMNVKAMESPKGHANIKWGPIRILGDMPPSVAQTCLVTVANFKSS